ncbi:MAG: hypothetical protein ACR2NJ_13005 [Acidimicrobiales bacterium]
MTAVVEQERAGSQPGGQGAGDTDSLPDEAGAEVAGAEDAVPEGAGAEEIVGDVEAPGGDTPGKELAAVRDRLASIRVDATLPPGATPEWVEPCKGECPDSHPVKAKVRSRLFHLPGMIAYARTNADRCYRSAEAAEADGFTRSKR